MSGERIPDAVMDRFLEVELRRGGRQPDLSARVNARLGGDGPRVGSARRLLVAAALVIGVAVLIGVQWLADPAGLGEAVEPAPWSKPHDPPWEVKSLAEVRALPVGTTSVRGKALDAEAIAALGRLRDLRYLELVEPENGEGLLDQLAGLVTLQALVIHRALPVGDLAPLRGLPNLQRLAVRYAKVQDDDLGELASFSALTDLDLTGNQKITAKGVAAIAKVDGLQRLKLADTVLVPFEKSEDLERPTEASRRIAILGRMAALRHLSVQEASELEYGEKPLVVLVNPMPVVGRFTIAELAVLDRLESLEISSQDVDDTALESIGQMQRLRSLMLGSTSNVTVDGLAALGGQLRHLRLSSCTNVYGELPKNLLSLESFAARWCRYLGDESIASLAGAKLQRLGLRYCPNLTPDCLATLSGWPLRELDLAGLPWLGDDEVQRIAALPALQSLDLSSTQDSWGFVVQHQPQRNRPVGGGNAITADGFASLAAAQRLRFLSLAGLGRIDVEDLQPLAALQLAQLDLRGTELTAAAGGATADIARGLWPKSTVVAGELDFGKPTEPRFRAWLGSVR